MTPAQKAAIRERFLRCQRSIGSSLTLRDNKESTEDIPTLLDALDAAEKANEELKARADGLAAALELYADEGNIAQAALDAYRKARE